MDLPPSDLPNEDDSSSGSGSLMEFTLDVIEDVASRVEDMMRLCALGHFGEAIKHSADLFDRKTDVFPVKVECMRLLLEQGDYKGIHDYIARQFSDDIVRLETIAYGGYLSTMEDAASLQDVILIQLLQISKIGQPAAQAETGRKGISTSLIPWVEVVRKEVYDPLECFALMLDLKLRQMQNTLAFASSRDLQHCISRLILVFLENDQVWAIPGVLRSCSFEASPLQSKIFELVLSSADTGSLEGEEESVQLAKMDLLQTFLEACLTSKNWKIARHLTIDSPTFTRALKSASNIEEALIRSLGSAEWKTTRMRIRRELLKFDLSFANLLPEGASWNEDLLHPASTSRTLQELETAARANEDLRCVRGCAWRLSNVDEELSRQHQSLIHTMLEDFVPTNLYSPGNKDRLDLTTQAGSETDLSDKIIRSDMPTRTASSIGETASSIIAAKASLVISGVGLVALVNDVTELFGGVSSSLYSSRTTDRRSEQLIIHLEMARLAYMQWMSAVNIVEPIAGEQTDLSTFRSQSGDTLERLLKLIKAAFQDAEKAGTIGQDTTPQSAVASDAEPNDLSKLGDELRNLANERQKNTRVHRMTYWASKDKKGLEELVAKVSQNVQNLNSAFPTVFKTIESLTMEDIRHIADPRDAENLARLELIKQMAASANPFLERSADQAIIEGHTYRDMKIGNRVNVMFGNQVSEGDMDPAWARKGHLYDHAKVKDHIKLHYGDQIIPQKGFWD